MAQRESDAGFGTSGQWYVRMSSGTVYGPESTAGLRSWVAEGRVLPDDEISDEKKLEWRRAQDVQELEMDYMIERSDGSIIGPFHKDAISPMISEGKIPSDSKIFHKSELQQRLAARQMTLFPEEEAASGEDAKVAGGGRNAGRAAHGGHDSESGGAAMEEALRERNEARHEAERLTNEIEALRQEIEDFKQQAKDAIAENQREADELRDELAKANDAIAAEKSRAASLERENSELSASLENSNDEAMKLRSGAVDAGKMASASAASLERIGELEGELETARVQMEQFEAALKAANEKLAASEKSVDSLSDTHEKESRALLAQVESLTVELERAKAAGDEARSRISAAESDAAAGLIEKNEEIRALQERLARAERDGADKGDELRGAVAQLGEVRGALASKQDELEKLRESNSRTIQKLAGELAELRDAERAASTPDESRSLKAQIADLTRQLGESNEQARVSILSITEENQNVRAELENAKRRNEELNRKLAAERERVTELQRAAPRATGAHGATGALDGGAGAAPDAWDGFPGGDARGGQAEGQVRIGSAHADAIADDLRELGDGAELRDLRIFTDDAKKALQNLERKFEGLNARTHDLERRESLARNALVESRRVVLERDMLRNELRDARVALSKREDDFSLQRQQWRHDEDVLIHRIEELEAICEKDPAAEDRDNATYASQIPGKRGFLAWMSRRKKD